MANHTVPTRAIPRSAHPHRPSILRPSSTLPRLASALLQQPPSPQPRPAGVARACLRRFPISQYGFGNPRIRLASPRSSFPSNRAISSHGLKAQAHHEHAGYLGRLKVKLKATKLNWKPIPIWVGATLLGVLAYLKKQERAVERQGGIDPGGVKIEGPWQVHVLGALPLRSISRLYGLLNSYTLPLWSRVPGYRLYSWIFGVDLDEAETQDLKQFASLNDFFLRKLKPGCRPIDTEAALVSPADGRVINFGTIEGRRVASVKGMSYSLDALLVGRGNPSSPSVARAHRSAEETSVSDSEFANINDIPYSIDQLMGSREMEDNAKEVPVSTHNSISKTAKVLAEVARGELESAPKEGNRMFFFVVYLAPGDYHHFHSPANWLVERRRHFAGELFSVSPWMLGKLADLFVLNERVALLGKWRHGFFSMTPVGATNVGSIIINFDRDLRTNMPERKTYEEAVYAKGLIGGQILQKGEEVGGFSLGSTIVLVFEAPEKFTFSIKKGDLVKVGQGVGNLND